MRFSPLGDQAVLITLGDRIDLETHQRVRRAVDRIRACPPPGLVDLVPAFASIAVHYNALDVRDDQPYDATVRALEAAMSATFDDVSAEPRVVEIPVCYGGELGPDIEDVARAHEMTVSDVIALHTGGEYLVYMLGFMPGFAYLGGLSERLATPRRSSPRTAVPAGAVGIGGQQTGVYPMVSPGGWNLIGRTPRVIFDSNRAEPSLLATGDRVRFRPITRDEFDAWRE